MSGGMRAVQEVSLTLDELVTVEPWAVLEVVEGLRLASEAGLLTNVHRVTSEEQAHLLGEPIASFSPPHNRLYVSPQNARREWLNWLGQENFLVGDGIAERVVHECIHAEHLHQLGDTRFMEMLTEELTTDEKDVLRSEVSEYATEMPSEAVAEIGVLLVADKRVSQEIREIYTRLGGPSLAKGVE